MTTSRSPLRAIKQQAETIARMIKGFERGEIIDVKFAALMAQARSKPAFKFGIVMDDKVITIEMTWDLLRQYGETEISEYILKLMRGERERLN